MLDLLWRMCCTAGIDCRAAVLICFNTSLLSTMTPMASNGALISYSLCGFSIKDVWKWTVPAAFVAAVTTIIMTVIAFPPV